jgi:hypothetical protein
MLPIWVTHPLPPAQRLLLSYSSQPTAYKVQDIVAVPVIGENCTQLENSTSTDPGPSPFHCTVTLEAYPCRDSIEIDWQLSYSGRSPLKFFSALLIPSERVPHNESDYKKAMAHDKAELMSEYPFHKEAQQRAHKF